MCDCYSTICEVCKKRIIPVHITDFCISRDDIKIYCQRHIPKRDVVVHKIIEDEYRYKSELSLRRKKRNPIEYPLGWKMGVRYLRKPSLKYGYDAVTPNVCAEHIGKVIPKRGSPFWITEWTNKNYTTETEAVEDMVNLRADFSPSEQAWRRYSIKLKGGGLLKKLNVPKNVLDEIKLVSEKLRERYKNILAIILIGSFAEGNAEKDSDLDIVFIKVDRIRHKGLWNITKGMERRIQLIQFNKKTLDSYFRDSATMAYAIQRGRIIYQRKGFLKKYYSWPLGFPNNEWMEGWFNHWIDKYSYGVKDFKRCKKMNFDYVSDCLSRAVVNFGILFVEARGSIPTTKKDLEGCFNKTRPLTKGRDKEIKDKKIIQGFKIALQSHHEDRDLSLNEVEKVYNAGEFLKDELKKYFREVKKNKEHLDKIMKSH